MTNTFIIANYLAFSITRGTLEGFYILPALNKVNEKVFPEFQNFKCCNELRDDQL